MRMRQTTVETTMEELDFAQKAAAYFAAHPDKSSYGDLDPESFLALRWGLGEDCVLVLKLHDYHQATNYTNIIRAQEPIPEQPIPDDSPF
jgi:hypothetical protein